MTNIIKSQISVSDLKPGMTVEYKGEMLTVSKNDVKKGFCGYSFRGDASKKEITRIQFAVPTKFGISLR